MTTRIEIEIAIVVATLLLLWDVWHRTRRSARAEHKARKARRELNESCVNRRLS